MVRDEVLRQVLEKMVTGAKDISAVHYEKIHSLCRAEEWQADPAAGGDGCGKGI